MHFSITKRLPKLATLAIVSLLAACSSERVATPLVRDIDPATNVVAPLHPTVVREQAIATPEVDRPAATGHSTFLSATGVTTSYSFTVNPTATQTFIFGVHMVRFPANTICNPNASGYGPSTWLTACQKQSAPMNMVATTWTDALGRARIDFNLDIRFYPNASGELPAIYLLDPAASWSAYSRIDYCFTSGSCVDEAASDALLRTQRDPISGYLYRIIRHFSGYNVWA